MIERVAGAAGGVATGAVLGAVAALRRAKAVHPRGAVHEATLSVAGSSAAPAASTLLSRPGEHRALVRISRSLGLPPPLPELFGLAIRVLDAYGSGAHQDFLLITSADRPVLHRVFVPARDPHRRVYSSALPYVAGEERLLVGALPAGEDYDLAVARLDGRFAPVGALTLGARLPERYENLRFNVRHTGGGLEPVGVLNRMRDFAYPMSQWAWERTRPDSRVPELGTA